MANEPSEPKPVNDAALMSARLMALKDEDEIEEERSVKQPPPRPTPPPAARKTVLLKRLGLVCLGGILLGVGYKAGAWRTNKKVDQEPAVFVNGELISKKEFSAACETAAGRATMQQLIDEKLTLQFARKKNVMPTPQMVDSRLSAISRQPNFYKTLQQANQTTDDFKRALTLQLVKTALVDQGVPTPTNSEVHRYYLENSDPKNPRARFYHPETVTIQVIISNSEEDVHNAEKDLAAGVPFATAVGKYSKDVSKSRNGVLGPFRHGQINSQKFPGLEKQLFDRVAPAQLEPIKFGVSWWLIKEIAHTQESTDPYDKVMDACRSGLIFAKGEMTNGQTLNQEKQDFLKNAKIDIRLPQYSDLLPKR